MGYSTHFDGDAYETVSGQNANNSVRVTDEFMNSLDDPDATIELKGRIDSSINKKYLYQNFGMTFLILLGDVGIQEYNLMIQSMHGILAPQEKTVNIMQSITALMLATPVPNICF